MSDVDYERQALHALARNEKDMSRMMSNQLEALYQENVKLRQENARLCAMLERVREVTGLYLLRREIDDVLNSGAGLS